VTRNGLIVSGGAIIVAGIAFATLTSDHAFQIIALCSSVVFGLARIVRGLQPFDTPPGAWTDDLADRFGPPDSRPQLAGSKCAACAQKIMSEMEAALCRQCGAALHRGCRKDHRVEAHRERSGQAYR